MIAAQGAEGYFHVLYKYHLPTGYNISILIVACYSSNHEYQHKRRLFSPSLFQLAKTNPNVYYDSC